MLAGELLNSLIRRKSNYVTRQNKKEKASETSLNLDQKEKKPQPRTKGSLHHVFR
jgi:hypothetical protein